MSRFAFRAWDTKESRMLPWPDILELTAKDLFCSGRYIVMQWIGEQDKEGRQIYEGDIVDMKYGDQWPLYIVSFDIGGAKFTADPIDQKILVRPAMNGGTTKSLAIRGNIYETPELAAGGSSAVPSANRQERDEVLAAINRFRFRAWDNKRRIMLSWVSLLDSAMRKLFNSGRYFIMQWAGGTTRIGTPIYEGDIVTYAKDAQQKPYIAYWAKDWGFWTFPIIPGDRDRPSLDLDSTHNIVVIGNTHENPELARYNRLEDIYQQEKGEHNG